MTDLGVLDDLLPVLVRGQVLFIGEIVGTKEFPQLVADLVMNVAIEGQPVVVGLEVPFSEPLDGERWGGFWTRDAVYADGRSSLAMAELVTTLADLRAAGHAVTTVGLDGPWVAPGSTIELDQLAGLDRDRDQAMAGHLLAAMDAEPKAAGIVLADPAHTGVSRGSGTMGSIVAPWFPGSVALLGLATGGQALTLLPEGPVAQPVAADAGVGVGAVWSADPGADGQHGFVNLGIVTAADPFDA